MQPTADFDAGRLARSLLRRSRQGALATLMAGSGDPYCSLVNVASHPDGSPILLISRLAVHTRNILGRCQGLADAGRAGRGRPAGGSADHAGGPGRGGLEATSVAILRRRYLNAHPSAEAFVDFKDFSFFRIRPSGTHLVAGFGRIVDLKPEQFLTDISDAGALLEAEQGAIDHMNADHRDAMNLYATRLLGAGPPTGAAPAAIPRGIDLQAGATTLRLDFPERVTGPGELRKMLVRLAEEARARK